MGRFGGGRFGGGGAGRGETPPVITPQPVNRGKESDNLPPTQPVTPVASIVQEIQVAPVPTQPQIPTKVLIPEKPKLSIGTEIKTIQSTPPVMLKQSQQPKTESIISQVSKLITSPKEQISKGANIALDKLRRGEQLTEAEAIAIKQQARKDIEKPQIQKTPEQIRTTSNPIINDLQRRTTESNIKGISRSVFNNNALRTILSRSETGRRVLAIQDAKQEAIRQAGIKLVIGGEALVSKGLEAQAERAKKSGTTVAFDIKAERELNNKIIEANKQRQDIESQTNQVDINNANEVNAYVKQVEAYNRKVELINKEQERLNARPQKGTSQVKTFLTTAGTIFPLAIASTIPIVSGTILQIANEPRNKLAERAVSAGAGLIATKEFISTQPEKATGMLLGSVLAQEALGRGIPLSAKAIKGETLTPLKAGQVIEVKGKQVMLPKERVIAGDIVQQIFTPEGQFVAGQFRLKVKTPPSFAFRDTNFKKLARALGSEERGQVELVRTGKGQTRVVMTPELDAKQIDKILRDVGGKLPNVEDLPFVRMTKRGEVFAVPIITKDGRIVSGMTAESRIGKATKVIKLQTLRGKQEAFNIQRLSAELTSQELDILKALDKNKVGFVSTEGDAQFFKGGLERKDILKFKFDKGELIITPKVGNRKITRGQTIARVAEQKFLQFGEETGKELLKTELALKDITLPRFKRGGKISLLEGATIVLEPKFVGDIDVNVISNAKMNLLSKQKLKQGIVTIKAQEALALKSLRESSQAVERQRISRMRKAISERLSQRQEMNRIASLPIIVGGAGRGTSRFAGQGTIQDFALEPLAFDIRQPVKTFSPTSTRSIDLSINKEIQKGLTKEITKEIQKDILKDIQKGTLKEIQKGQLKQIQKLNLKSIQKLNLKELQKITMVPPTVIPRIGRGGRVRRFPLGESQRRKEIETPKGFDVLVRRRGQFKIVGADLPEGLAKRLGSNIALRTLARTFTLRETGREARMKDIKFDLPMEKFRLPKSRALNIPRTLVQRSKFSLASLGERREIQQARRMLR